MPSRTLMSACAVSALVCGLASQATAQDMIVGLITKTDTNPFFVKMKEGAEAQARESGMELRSYAGRYDGDNETQVEAIESLIAAGAKGILLTPSDSAAIVPTVQKARDAGILVIALDTQLEPSDAADATFATDNFRAGELIGAWAAATLGEEAANARIALLDLSEAGISVDVQRNQGFLTGFGIDVNDPTRMRDETDPRIVGNDITQGAEEGGRRAMENLLQRDQGINVVYTINEPAAAGAYEALNAFGFAEQALIVSIDGGCPGVMNVGTASSAPPRCSSRCSWRRSASRRSRPMPRPARSPRTPKASISTTPGLSWSRTSRWTASPRSPRKKRSRSAGAERALNGRCA
jgi:fructose transport system substrate-binding protein